MPQKVCRHVLLHPKTIIRRRACFVKWLAQSVRFSITVAANLPLCRLFVLERFLTDHPEEVESNHRQYHYQGIGGKLPGRKRFHIYVSLQFAVVLLAFPMSMVGCDDVIIGPSQVGPEHVQFNVRNHEDLAMLINGAFNDFIDDPHPIVFVSPELFL